MTTKKDWVSQRVKTKNRAPKVKSELNACHSTHPFLKGPTRQRQDRERKSGLAHQDGCHQPSLSRSPGQLARPGTAGEGAGEGALWLREAFGWEGANKVVRSADGTSARGFRGAREGAVTCALDVFPPQEGHGSPPCRTPGTIAAIPTAQWSVFQCTSPAGWGVSSAYTWAARALKASPSRGPGCLVPLGPPALLTFCASGWDKWGTGACGVQTRWKRYSGTIQHVGSSSPGDPPPRGAEKIPAGTQSSSGHKSRTLFWRLASITVDGPGHSDSTPAWVGQAGLWPAPPSKGKTPHQPCLLLQYLWFLASSSSQLGPGEGLVAEG